MSYWMTSALTATESVNWGERASTAGVVTLLGMVTIFVVLALLWGAIEIMHLIVGGGKKEKKAAPVQSEPAPSVPQTVSVAPVASTDDGATVAAITAAITAYLAQEGYTEGFRVVSFKRASVNSRRNKF